MAKEQKAAAKSFYLPRGESREFYRVDCNLNTEFRLKDELLWAPARVVDLSVAGMKVRFAPFFRGRTFLPEQFDWAESAFRFFLDGEFFQINGFFLRVYLREPGSFTAGVEFDNPTPEEQFKLVALFQASRKNNNLSR